MNEQTQIRTMEGYYRFHAHIYDLTRWSFLFGRKEALHRITTGAPQNARVLEVGCGTGRNLLQLHQLRSDLVLTGIDISESMIGKAEKKCAVIPDLQLINQPYSAELTFQNPFDIILFSYCLTMVNPGYENLLDAASQHLRPSGHIVIADFHQTSNRIFARWMQKNHVRMQGQVLQSVDQRFTIENAVLRKAYGGLWEYVVIEAGLKTA